MQTLDMLGKPCPIPVVEAKKALAENGTEGVVILVDNSTAVQNLERLAQSNNYDFACQTLDEKTFTVTITSNGRSPLVVPSASPAAVPHTAGSGLVVLIPSEEMGRGSEELGKILIKGFVFSLTQLSPAPEAVIFLNSGAKLTAEGANTIDDLKTLENSGTKILTCGTCANYYSLQDKLAVGEITDMMGITSTLAGAAKVISV